MAIQPLKGISQNNNPYYEESDYRLIFYTHDVAKGSNG